MTLPAPKLLQVLEPQKPFQVFGNFRPVQNSNQVGEICFFLYPIFSHKFFKPRIKYNMEFIKMNGAGNDYIFVEDYNSKINNGSNLSEFLSNRNFGIGADGLIIIRQGYSADAKMIMFNADGSEGKMCGNAIRCLAKIFFESKFYNSTSKPQKNSLKARKSMARKENKNFVKTKTAKIFVETLSGIKTLILKTKNDVVTAVQVNMGHANFEKEKVPTLLNFGEKIAILGKSFFAHSVSVGNPHCVVFLDEDVDKFDVSRFGPLFENSKSFPEKVNVEFVNVLSPNNFKARVFERGSGETLSCGTGACAISAVAKKLGIIDSQKTVQIQFKGGMLKVDFLDEDIFLSGEFEETFRGTFNDKILKAKKLL
jgi:diaminopimelate epimerase